jgi:hypothetical protein
MLKGVVSFYYTHKITPTCFGSSLPSSGGYTFLVSYSRIVCRLGWMWIMVRSVWPAAVDSMAGGHTGVAYDERVTPEDGS